MRKILTVFTFCLLISCNNLSNHAHDGTYEFSMMGIRRSIILDGNNATSSSSITGTTKSQVKQFEDRLEYVEENGNVSVYYFLENGDLKVSDIMISRKVK